VRHRAGATTYGDDAIPDTGSPSRPARIRRRTRALHCQCLPPTQVDGISAIRCLGQDRQGLPDQSIQAGNAQPHYLIPVRSGVSTRYNWRPLITAAPAQGHGLGRAARLTSFNYGTLRPTRSASEELQRNQPTGRLDWDQGHNRAGTRTSHACPIDLGRQHPCVYVGSYNQSTSVPGRFHLQHRNQTVRTENAYMPAATVKARAQALSLNSRNMGTYGGLDRPLAFKGTRDTHPQPA